MVSSTFHTDSISKSSDSQFVKCNPQEGDRKRQRKRWHYVLVWSLCTMFYAVDHVSHDLMQLLLIYPIT